MITGARIAVISGPSDFADYWSMRRNKDLAKWVDRHKLKLLCYSKPSAGRALDKDASHAGLQADAPLVREPLYQTPSMSYDCAVASPATHVNDETFVSSRESGDDLHVSDKVFTAESANQDTDISKDMTSRRQTLENQSNIHDADITSCAPQKSVEEAFGLLKEQVEADRRMQLANTQAMKADSITDSAKPLKRSKILAKQVISQSSARSIGFVSQLWVSARLLKVIALEVRPSLLSGEIDRVFLGDICQIGDVVLVSDESALENETTALDCETLVGYDVVTEDGKYVGKIRDYSFDLDDGKLTSLDFDFVGFSLVPSSLISTYRLDVEEVIEVLPDSILVKDGAESRIRRLTKGFWQLPAGGEKRRNQKIARSRMLKKTLMEGDDILSMSRQLPPNTRPRYLEGSELESLDKRAEPAERRLFRKDYSGPPPHYRNR